MDRGAETTCLYGVPTSGEWDSRTNGANTDESFKIYVADTDQKDSDEYAGRLTFAINTPHDRVRGDTPFYLIYGWDPRSTMEATLPLGSTKRWDQEPRRWLYQIQRQYQRARKVFNDRLRIAIQD